MFAGVTVLLAVSGMFLVNDAIFSSLGLAAIVVVALAVVSSVTLLPALLAMLGDNVNSLRIPFLGRTGGQTGGFWGWASDRVLARPAVLASVTLFVLLVMASPVLFLNLGFNGSKSLSDDIEAKEALEVLEDNFTLGLTVLGHGDGGLEQLDGVIVVIADVLPSSANHVTGDGGNV